MFPSIVAIQILKSSMNIQRILIGYLNTGVLKRILSWNSLSCQGYGQEDTKENNPQCNFSNFLAECSGCPLWPCPSRIDAHACTSIMCATDCYQVYFSYLHRFLVIFSLKPYPSYFMLNVRRLNVRQSKISAHFVSFLQQSKGMIRVASWEKNMYRYQNTISMKFDLYLHRERLFVYIPKTTTNK